MYAHEHTFTLGEGSRWFLQRRKLRPGRDEGQDLCSGAAYVLTSPIVSQSSASSPGSSAGLLWWGAQSSVLSLQPRPSAPPTPFLLSQVVQTRGLGIHVEFQRHVDSPEEGPPPPRGLVGDGGIRSHHVDMPLFTAGWHRKRRRCVSGGRNSTWTLPRYISRGGDMDPTTVGSWVAAGGGRGPHQGVQLS